MKTLRAKSAFTLIELLAVIVLIAILAALLLPSFTHVKSGRQVQCLSNQHQIAIGLIIFEDDHAGKFPWQESVTNGGSFESISDGQASAHFLALSPYIGRWPNILICLTDKDRHAVSNYSRLQNENISYFLNLDAGTNATSVLTGDRHLEMSRKSLNSGLFNYTTNMFLNWADGFHFNKKEPWGFFSFSDGHAQAVRQTELNSVLQKQPFSTNRFCIP